MNDELRDAYFSMRQKYPELKVKSSLFEAQTWVQLGPAITGDSKDGVSFVLVARLDQPLEDVCWVGNKKRFDDGLVGVWL